MNDELIDQEPSYGHGYIYILSNESMPDIFKVGLTTNSIGQRMRELSTTGVPQKFSVERLFEVDSRYLPKIEGEAHKILKSKGLHEGKEFFRCTLTQCVEAVEDSILIFAGDNAPELVQDALVRQQKVREEEAKREAQEAEQRRGERKELLKKETAEAFDRSVQKQVERIEERGVRYLFGKAHGIGGKTLEFTAESLTMGLSDWVPLNKKRAKAASQYLEKFRQFWGRLRADATKKIFLRSWLNEVNNNPSDPLYNASIREEFLSALEDEAHQEAERLYEAHGLSKKMVRREW